MLSNEERLARLETNLVELRRSNLQKGTLIGSLGLIMLALNIYHLYYADDAPLSRIPPLDIDKLLEQIDYALCGIRDAVVLPPDIEEKLCHFGENIFSGVFTTINQIIESLPATTQYVLSPMQSVNILLSTVAAAQFPFRAFFSSVTSFFTGSNSHVEEGDEVCVSQPGDRLGRKSTA